MLDNQVEPLHTPGEWKISKVTPTIVEVEISLEDGSPWNCTLADCNAEESSLGKYQSYEKLVANARLISKAPKMFAVLKKIVSMDECKYYEWHDEAKAVINEAEGN